MDSSDRKPTAQEDIFLSLWLFTALSILLGIVDFLLLQFSHFGAAFSSMWGSSVALGTIPMAIYGGQLMAALAVPFVLVFKYRVRSLLRLLPAFLIMAYAAQQWWTSHSWGFEGVYKPFHGHIIEYTALYSDTERVMNFVFSQMRLGAVVLLSYGIAIGVLYVHKLTTRSSRL